MSRRALPKDKLDEYRDILLLEKARIINSIKNLDDCLKQGSRESSGYISSYPLHFADLASDLECMEKDYLFLDRDKDELKAINIALGRIYDKSYGICEICGEYISPERLRILPHAKMCIKCKINEEKEKTG